jgi:hypothetical protein
MKKLRLDLETLAVESFSTARDVRAEGTVHGRAAAGPGSDVYDCHYTVSDYSVDVGCTDQAGCTAFKNCTGISVCFWTP